MNLSDIKFNEQGLVPAIAQDIFTSEVLMMAWMNKEALEQTLATGKAVYFSRSRNKLWLKGETSGNFQEVKSIHYDCDGDTILLMVDPKGPACHTGERTCFYRAMGESGIKPAGPRVMTELFRILKERKTNPPEKSYVASLYAKGLPKILEKIEEESNELIEAANEKGRSDVLYEFCDLWFHSLVLLANQGIEIEEVFGELGRRFGISGITEKESRGVKGKE
ncbi:MAG: bifunctional phosphoribosyl-AMP cyclohydrolase/phosphoribosyl-ATP diphosphatase HisIE [Deltaproteobacteria bacterium]|nr:bifunctional phosphoribosyl-AMP cyclohydrolase/phosphoribosyl-ATP diphosphatase HisIE [Deltaproteobacteria bacterium]